MLRETKQSLESYTQTVQRAPRLRSRQRASLRPNPADGRFTLPSVIQRGAIAITRLHGAGQLLAHSAEPRAGGVTCLRFPSPYLQMTVFTTDR
ncbi:hypothetical protein SKAU_G00143250 [Synaphobranchus kaupii]|uniref:Uncharacterized protein n=1 Tax=Synaphobranchus kaupii TaxID=118154 RepID=A0A9Q1J3I3_SYNKA|nr:hypothetical protein SKAU_G00143250 [Synaphobranchus kaupii]